MQSDGEFVYHVARRTKIVNDTPPNLTIHNINGQTGSAITISTNDIIETTNLFYTDARVNTFMTSKSNVAGGIVPLNADTVVSVDKLPIPAINAPIDKTYAEIAALILSDDLIPNQYYRMTDFQTIHRIPKTSIVYTSPVTEPLILHAEKTGNSFSVNAFSELYPTDIIHYQFVDRWQLSDAAEGFSYTSKGRIFYRKDTIKHIETYYDWRHVMFRRWKKEGTYNEQYVYNDIQDGDIYRDYLTFTDDTHHACIHTYFSGSGEVPTNNVFMSSCHYVTLNCQSDSNTFFGPINYFITDFNFNTNIVMSALNHVRMVQNTNNCVFGNGYTINTVNNTLMNRTNSMWITGNLNGANFDCASADLRITSNITNVMFPENYGAGPLLNINLTNCSILNNFAQGINDPSVTSCSNIIFGSQPLSYVHVNNSSPSFIYTIKFFETIVGVSSSTTIALTLPSTTYVDKCNTFIIKDELGVAGAHPITITPYTGQTINGSASSIQINTNYGAVKLICPSSGNWIIC